MSASTRIMVGHVLDRIKEIPDESVHMVWTSPPYWGLRAYGTEPQVWGGDPDCRHRWGNEIAGDRRRGQRGKSSILVKRTAARSQVAGRQSDKGAFCWDCAAWRGEHGQEPSLDMWLEHEVLIFREVRRVMRKDGTLWVNCGDAYSQGGNGVGSGKQTTNKGSHLPPKRCPGFKPKQRLMLPSRLAIALQDDGWWLRDEIVWHKRNPMPSGVTDRTCPAHEMLYMLSKSSRYFYDQVAIQEPITTDAKENYPGRARITGRGTQGAAAARGNDRDKSDGFPPRRSGNIARKYGDDRGRPGDHIGGSIPWEGYTRNKRSVWSLASEPCKRAHFATAPTALVAPCILAGTSRKGVCPECGAQWVRQTATTHENPGNRTTNGPRSIGRKHIKHGTAGYAVRLEKRIATTGWAPSCACPEYEPVPATVLDPFGGSGTTGLVAGQLGRACILIELNPEYAAIAESRIGQGLVSVRSDLLEPEDRFAGLPLFEGAP